MKRIHQAAVVLAVLGGLALAATLYFTLPRTVKATINGTDVKRMNPGDKAGGVPGSRDVRFVYATTDDKQAMVFRNEDTGWGFPFYFKFNSGDIAAAAVNFAQNEKDTTVLVTYYGVRMPMFNAFPNITSLKAVSPDYVHIPIVNIIFLVVFFGLLIFVYLKLRKLFRVVGAKAQELVGRSDPPAEDAA